MTSHELPPDATAPRLARRCVDEALTEAPDLAGRRGDIRLAVGEAVANAVMHGRPPDGRPLELSFALEADALVARVRDYGGGCGSSTAKGAGYGRQLMGQLADGLRYEQVHPGVAVSLSFLRA